MVGDEEGAGDLSELAGIGGTNPKVIKGGESGSGQEGTDSILPELYNRAKFDQFVANLNASGRLDAAVVIRHSESGNFTVMCRSFPDMDSAPPGQRAVYDYEDITISGGPTEPLAEAIKQGRLDSAQLRQAMEHAAGLITRLTDMRERQERPPLRYHVTVATRDKKGSIGVSNPVIDAAVIARSKLLPRPGSAPSQGSAGPRTT